MTEGARVSVGSPPAAYEVEVAAGCLARVGPTLGGIASPGPALVVTDSNVASHYLDSVLASLVASGFSPREVVLSAGEETKSNETVLLLYDALLSLGADRSTPVVALGGGVVGDVAGYAAATWLRGIPWIALPTTLLAQVDASVGGKTGVNHGAGKNLVGAFHPPAAVLSDISTLATLDLRQWRSGLAEMLKTALVLDAGLLARIEDDPELLRDGNQPGLVDPISRCVRAKADVVTRDLREAGLRRVLNFGHTAGHAIEASCGYGPVLHGEAVAVGMMVAVRISIRRGLLDPAWEQRLGALLSGLHLPAEVGELAVEPRADLVARHLVADKKVVKGKLSLVLLTEPGRGYQFVDSTSAEVVEALFGG